MYYFQPVLKPGLERPCVFLLAVPHASAVTIRTCLGWPTGGLETHGIVILSESRLDEPAQLHPQTGEHASQGERNHLTNYPGSMINEH